MKKSMLLLLTIIFLHTLSAQHIPWTQLQNPIYGNDDWSVKDVCAIYHEESQTFYMFFSAFFHDNGRERSHVTGVRTKNFLHFSEPLFMWDGQEDGWIGMCSPNISKMDGKYIMTYNSWGDKKRKPNQLFYAESTDLENWEKHIPLAPNLTRGVRGIDASVFRYKQHNYLIWKRKQTAQISFNEKGGLSDTPWLNMGGLNMGWFENAQVFEREEELFLLCTTKKNAQKLYTQKTPEDIWAFTQWEFFTEITVPIEEFNTDDHMNASFILDHTQHDGYYYCLYAGRTESESHLGRGDNKLGVARSKDLLNWEIPGRE